MLSLLAWLQRLVAWLERRQNRRRFPERTEECICGAALPVSRAHIVRDVIEDLESDGGWTLSAAFCAAHCPGGCNHQEDHDHADP